MQLQAQNFEMYAGDSKRIIVSVYSLDNAPVNIGGSSIRWVVYKYRNQHIIIKTINNGIDVIYSGDNNKFVINLVPQDTADLSGTFKHMAEVVDNSGNISTILVGNITILPVPFTR